MAERLSAVIITRDAAEVLRPCLESLSFADEIVVVDSGSRDQTLAIAREFTAAVYSHTDWQGFGVQRNRALAYASADWMLVLDADERVGPELRHEIARLLATAPATDVWCIPRQSTYCGRVIRHSGWSPDYVARLFRRGRAQYSEDLVHERLRFTGDAGRLQAPILHESYRSLEEVLEKMNRYSSAGAAQLAAAGRRGGLAAALGHAAWAFLRSYVLRLGLLDGREGLLLAISNAEGTYYRYLKLMYLNESGRRRRPDA